SNLHRNQGADASTLMLAAWTPHPQPLSRKGRGENDSLRHAAQDRFDDALGQAPRPRTLAETQHRAQAPEQQQGAQLGIGDAELASPPALVKDLVDQLDGDVAGLLPGKFLAP